MKPSEILAAIPQWSSATAEGLLASPAWSMPCRLGDAQCAMTQVPRPIDTLDLAILLEDEPHVLHIGDSPSFAELHAVWNNRADIPEPILLALVEKDCGPLLQLLENATRRRLKLVGLADATGDSDAPILSVQVSDISFALTLSDAVTATLGNLRNLDLAHESIRSVVLPAVAEYAAFVLPAQDASGLAVGDAVLLPEIGSIPPRLVADGRFVVDGNGVAPFEDDGRCRVVAAEPCQITLGELFDVANGGQETAEQPKQLAAAPQDGSQLRLVQRGKTLANGHLEHLADQPAFIIESL